jgi:hypothetical protein
MPPLPAVSRGLAVLFLTLVAACVGSLPDRAGPCDGDGAAAICGETCSADSTCGFGFHCAGDACSADCTLGGAQCGPGAVCDGRGRCVDVDSVGPDCPDVTVRAERRKTDVQLVIDRSGSMNLPFGKNVDRWTAIGNALTDPAAGVVSGLDSQIVFGASLYSSVVGATTCPNLVTVERSLGNAASIADLLVANRPSGDTPTAEAIDAALAVFRAQPPVAERQPVIVLATDGEPDTCTSGTDVNRGRANAVAAAKRAASAGITLYILSVGPEIAESHLQDMANAGAGLAVGGVARAPFFVANDQDELAAQLQAIIGTIGSCDLDLDARIDPVSVGLGTVRIGERALVFGRDWEQVDDDTIRVIGAACRDLLATATEVSASFPCGTVVD